MGWYIPAHMGYATLLDGLGFSAGTGTNLYIGAKIADSIKPWLHFVVVPKLEKIAAS
jgi:hypothetical protein